MMRSWKAAVTRLGNGVSVLVLACCLVAGLVRSAQAVEAHAAPYASPYSINFVCPLTSLTFDFNTSPRNDYTQSSNTPFAQWYNQATYPVNNPNDGNGTSASWGPWPANYPAVTVPANIVSPCDVLTWKRERVVAVAQQYIGYNYQHHHIPDFNPYASQPSWPASNPAVLVNYPTMGIDCSDFTSWNYNFGLGIVLNTGVALQAVSTTPLYGPGSAGITPAVIGQGMDFATLCQTLRTGDLLYIKGSSTGPITHVIMWLGVIGSGGPDYLVLDSHDNSPPVVDSNNVTIPPGVHIRPFRENEYYFQKFDHALRFIQVGSATPAMTLLLEGND